MERPLQEQRGLYSMGLSPSCGLPAFTSMVPSRAESRKDGILGVVQPNNSDFVHRSQSGLEFLVPLN
jgi:hypothetical protein